MDLNNWFESNFRGVIWRIVIRASKGFNHQRRIRFKSMKNAPKHPDTHTCKRVLLEGEGSPEKESTLT
jgi:hypothetical protein